MTTEGQSKVHLPSTVWKQPKDTKDWGDEYISKEQPERGKDMGQSRYSSADNIICEPSLAGKDRVENWLERLKAAFTSGVSWLVISFYRGRHTSQFLLLGGNVSGPLVCAIDRIALHPGHPFSSQRPGRFRVLMGL